MWNTFLNWYHDGGMDVTLFSIVMVVLLSFLFDRFMCHVINRIFRGEVTVGQNNRRITLKRVLKNVTHYVVAFVSVIIILSELGINVASILAAAGVIGLAVSFGAQSLIKDIFAGFFIIFEDQYGVGEYITVNNNFTGVVELVGLRITEIRGDNGELIVIPNGSITDVVNYCRGGCRIKEIFEISFDSDIDRAEQVIQGVVKKYCDEHPESMFEGRPVYCGVDMIGSSGISISAILWVQPMTQWRIAGELRKLVVQTLQEEGIDIPYPVTEVITKEGSHGN